MEIPLLTLIIGSCFFYCYRVGRSLILEKNTTLPERVLMAVKIYSRLLAMVLSTAVALTNMTKVL